MQPNNTAIDIIITTRNGAGRIDALLESLSRQTHKDFSCHVVDDHSDDGTAALIRSKYDWVRVIESPSRRGPALNRNVAAAQGKNPYLVFLDDDVVLKDEQWLAKGVAHFQNYPKLGQLATMIVSGFDEDVLLDCGINGKGPTFPGTYWRMRKDQVYAKHVMARRVLGACSAGTMVRRDVFEMVSGFDGRFFYMCEDLELSLKIHLAGYDIRYEPDMVTHHYEGQVMGQNAGWKQYLYYRNNLLVWLQYFPWPQIRRRLGWIFLRREKKSPSVSGNEQPGQSRKFPKIMSILKAIGFVVFHVPLIFSKRKAVGQWRKRSRDYLPQVSAAMYRETALTVSVRGIILMITNACNAKCPMCFLYNDLNKDCDILSAEEIDLMSASTPDLQQIVLGGGEPLLRKDLEQIASKLIDRHPKIAITIPTNGSLVERLEQTACNLLKHGCRRLVISLSLDGLPEYHDRNRGIAGLTEKVLLCYRKLARLQWRYPLRLKIQVNTCVTGENFDQVEEIYRFVRKNMPQAQWVFEPVRGAFNTDEVDALSLDQWRSLAQRFSVLTRGLPFWAREKNRKNFHACLMAFYEKSQPIPCFGGDEFLSVDFTGKIFPCESWDQPIADLRQIDYDFNNLVMNQGWQKAQRQIIEKQCYCTHACWMAYSLDKKDS